MKNKICIFFILFSTFVFGQNQQIGGVFPTLNLSYKPIDKIKLETYTFWAVPMINEIDFSPTSLIFYNEFDISYITKKNLSFTASYTYERLNPFQENFRNENRFWIQAQYVLPFKDWEIKNRIRYDFRWIKHNENFEFNPRIRYLIGLKKPFKNKEMYFNLYQEFFFNTFESSPFIYVENWFYAGLGKTWDKFSVELGYLNLTWVNDADKNLFIQHYFQPTFIYSF